MIQNITLINPLPESIIGKVVKCVFNYMYISEDGEVTKTWRENCLVFCQVEILEEDLNVCSN